MQQLIDIFCLALMNVTTIIVLIAGGLTPIIIFSGILYLICRIAERCL